MSEDKATQACGRIVERIDAESALLNRAEYIDLIDLLESEIKCRQDCINEEEGR